jgi:thioredoxin 1
MFRKDWHSVTAAAGLMIAATIAPTLATPRAVDPNLTCGRDCIKKAQYQQATKDLEAVVKKDPQSCEGHYLLGFAYCKMHTYAKARDQFRTAIKVGHGSPNAQKANAMLMTLPKQFLAPRTGPGTRMLASMLGLTGVRGEAPRPTVIDFYAPWCKPCKDLNVMIDKAKSDYDGKVNFMTINVDDPTNAKLIDQYEISPIPTLVFLNPAGEVVTFSVGYSGEGALANGLKKVLPAG